MEIIFTNPVNGRKWKLKPYNNGLCLSIYRQPLGEISRSGLEIKSDFVPIDHYPSTWAQGIRSVLRLMCLDTKEDETIDIDWSDDLEEKITEIFERKVSEIEIEIKE